MSDEITRARAVLAAADPLRWSGASHQDADDAADALASAAMPALLDVLESARRTVAGTGSDHDTYGCRCHHCELVDNVYRALAALREATDAPSGCGAPPAGCPPSVAR